MDTTDAALHETWLRTHATHIQSSLLRAKHPGQHLVQDDTGTALVHPEENKVQVARRMTAPHAQLMYGEMNSFPRL